MAGTDPRGSNADEFVIHRFDGDDSLLATGRGYGKGQPRFYVWLDVDNGGHLWWLDADEADRLGKRLIEDAAACRDRNDSGAQ